MGGDRVFVENGVLVLEVDNVVVEVGFVEEVGIWGEEREEVGEIDGVMVVDRVVVDRGERNGRVVNLVDEDLVGFEEVKFVRVEGVLGWVNEEVEGIVWGEVKGVGFG